MKKFIVTLIGCFFALNCYSQITVTYFNAEWNKANGVDWINKLSDCDISKVDVGKNPKIQQKHNVVVVPTIIIFQDGEEVKRYQADISFKMTATRKEIQEAIDELIMSDF